MRNEGSDSESWVPRNRRDAQHRLSRLSPGEGWCALETSQEHVPKVIAVLGAIWKSSGGRAANSEDQDQQRWFLPQPDDRFAFNERGLLFTQGSNALQSFYKLFPGELIEAVGLAIEFDPMDDAIDFGPTGQIRSAPAQGGFYAVGVRIKQKVVNLFLLLLATRPRPGSEFAPRNPGQVINTPLLKVFGG
jgi:hypothetical protein